MSLPQSVKDALFQAVEARKAEQIRDRAASEAAKPSVGLILRDHLWWINDSEQFSSEQKRTARMIASCKTLENGLYVEYCPKCKKTVSVHYKSCNNRHCPGCQYPMQKKWMELRESETIAGTPYFHIILTLPHELNDLIAANSKLLLSNLFRSSAEAVIELCKDPRYLGATPGIISVLHTWTQDLKLHYHIHMICTAGGITPTGEYKVLENLYKDDVSSQEEKLQENGAGGERVLDDLDILEVEDTQETDLSQEEDAPSDDPSASGSQENNKNAGFFLPLKAITILFRGKFMSTMRSLYEDHKLSLPPELEHLNNPFDWSTFCGNLYTKSWNGFITKTCKGCENAIDYLARYTYRTAISNSRIVGYDGTHVTILVRDNDHPKERKQLTLGVYEFISRLLQHVLPKSFTRVRSYGFLSNGTKTRNLNLIHKQLSGKTYTPSPVKDLKGLSLMEYFFPGKINCKCPDCGCELDTYFFRGGREPVLISITARGAPAA